MFQFAEPQAFLYLWIIPIVIFVYLVFYRRAEKQLREKIGDRLYPFLTSSLSRKKRKIKIILQTFVLVGFIIALARPQMGQSQQTVKSQGVEVIYAVDVSESMMSEDVKPSRLEQVKAELSRLLDMMPGNKVGVVAFAGSSALLCPLSNDPSAIKMYLESLTPEVVSAQGTSFKEAFETSKEAFERGGITADASTKVTRVILMASDGEDHEPGAAEMAETLAKDGIKIFTLAYGTQSGGPIPIRDANGFLVSYKKDKSGQTVTTTVHGDELKKLAQAGKGSFYHAVFGGRHLESLVDDFTKLEKSDFESMMATQYEERFQFPLFLAILLALIELFLGERTQSFRLWNGRFEVPLGSVSFWFCSILFFEMLMSFAPQAVAEVEKSPAVIHEHKNTQSETPLQALQLNKKGAELLKEQNYSEAFQYFTKALALDPYSVEIQLNMGIALEGMEQGEKALQIDKGALEMAQTPEMKYYALFNVAQLFGKQKKIDEALHYYQEALKINPLSKEAKVNIELLIKDQQNQSKGGKGSKDPKDQKGDQKSEGENSEQNKDKEKDKDSPKKYAPQKPQPQKFKGDKLNESDVSKILGELKNQEQRIRKEYYKKEAKEKGRDKDW